MQALRDQLKAARAQAESDAEDRAALRRNLELSISSQEEMKGLITQQQAQLDSCEEQALALKTKADAEIGKVRELAADAIQAEASGHAWESKYLLEHGKVEALEASLAERDLEWAAREEAHIAEMAQVEQERREAQVHRQQMREAKRQKEEEESLRREQEVCVLRLYASWQRSSLNQYLIFHCDRSTLPGDSPNRRNLRRYRKCLAESNAEAAYRVRRQQQRR